MTLVQGTRFGYYEILAAIGAGGMGEVYLARDTRLDRQVALKVLPAEFAKDVERMRRFVQEAKAASGLNHPGIITIFEIGEASGTHFIATEYIEGDTLRQRLQAGQMKRLDVLDIALQVASALSKAHQAGIVHRDVKPENLMLRPDRIVKVLDFGLAKLTVEPRAEADPDAATLVKNSTDPGTIMGTVSYMSPEQARARVVDGRTDIFSLGVVLYEMLTGRTPFAGESLADVLAGILDREAPPLSRFLDDAPHELSRIVDKALKKDRDERYQTMEDLFTDLQELRDDLALDARLERSGRAVSGRDENQKTLVAKVQTTDEQNAATITSGSQASTASESVAVVHRQRPRVIAVTALLLLLGATSVGYWWMTRQASARVIDSIAVMPFVNETGNADIDYLSDGMTETLIRSLAQIPNLSVKSRSTVFRYKGQVTSPRAIGTELGVPAILNGHFAQRANQLTVSVELIDTKTENVIWSEQYDRRQSDLVSLQSELARDVSSTLRTKLSGADEQKVTKAYTTNPAAYQNYLRGRFYWNKRNSENLRKAIEEFKAAADEDPVFALAYSGLADCYVVLPNYASIRSGDALASAMTYAKRAVELDPTLAEGYSSLGHANSFSWNFSEAEKAFRRSIELNPSYPTAHHWYSRFLRTMGRLDEASVEINRAHELDPLSLVIMNNVAEVLVDRGQWTAAEEQCKRMTELDPNYFAALQTLAVLNVKQGKIQEALNAAEQAADRAKRSNSTLALLGYLKARSGRDSAAQADLAELKARYTRKEADGRDLAIVYAGYNDKDKVFEWLEKSYANHSFASANLRLEPLLTPFHDDPRWNDLLVKVGLLNLASSTITK